MKKFVFFLIIFMALASCRTPKHNPATLQEVDLNHMVKALQDFRQSIHTVSGKADVRYKDKQHAVNLTVTFKVIRDSAIWMSFSPLLGIEVSRVLLSCDSVKWMDRINSIYYSGGFDKLSEIAGIRIDYFLLENILLSSLDEGFRLEAFLAEEENEFVHLHNYTRKSFRQHKRNPSDSTELVLMDLWLDKRFGRISKQRVKETFRNKFFVDVEYIQYQQFQNILFPGQLSIWVGGENEMRVSVKIEKFEINESVSLPFRIPEKYTSVAVDF